MLDKIFKDTDARMQKSIHALENEFHKLRTGRASPALLEEIKVPYYGVDTPLQQVASITVEDSRTLAVAPWEKTMVAPIEKAIIAANLGLNPVTVGTLIRVPLPPLTEDRRRDFVKFVKTEAENAKIAIRNIRRDSNANIKDLLKAKSITEDDERNAQVKIQKITDETISQVDKILNHKEKELMTV